MVDKPGIDGYDRLMATEPAATAARLPGWPGSRRPVLERTRVVRWYLRRERVILGLAGLVGFFVAWQVGSDAGAIDRQFFSSPVAIAGAAAREVQLARFWNDVRISAIEFLVGAVLAVVTAIPLGLAIGWYRRVGYALDPWLNLFNALPRIALLPVLVLWVGLGLEAKIAVVFLGGFFSIIVPTANGVRTVDRQLIEVGRIFKASQRRIFTAIVLPSTMPYIVSGIHIAIGRALLGVVVGDLYAQTQGLGVMIHRAADLLQSDRMLVGVLIFTVAGVSLTAVVGLLERRVYRWRPRLEAAEQNA